VAEFDGSAAASQAAIATPQRQPQPTSPQLPLLGSRTLAICLMVASGFAALGYQIVWTQQSALWLGHESAAVFAVVGAFFIGLAAGAMILGQRITASTRPGRWYAGCEAVAGGWGLILIFLIGPAAERILSLLGERPTPTWQWAVAFVSTALILLPATAAMGATLPAMEKCLSQFRRDGANVAALYAGNTFGAVLGVLGTAFWLIPAIGFSSTVAICVSLNVFCSLAALKLFGVAAPIARAEPLDRHPPRVPHHARLIVMLLATGLLGIGYEVVAVRVLNLVAENTVYTFALLVAVYLIGTTLGAAAYDHWARTRRSIPVPMIEDRQTGGYRVQNQLLQLLAAACLLGLLGLGGSLHIKAGITNLLGQSMTAALAAEATMAAAAFLLPTIVMGALFSHITTGAIASGISFGRALALNTIGAAIAPLIFGVLLLPHIGAKSALLLIPVFYLLMTTRRAWSKFGIVGACSVVIGFLIWAPTLRFIDLPQGGRTITARDGALASVTVIEDAEGVARLHINNRQQEGSSATIYSDARQALIPVLLHPHPARALFLGLGTSITASSAAEELSLEVDAVELLPEVVEASAYFRQKIAGSERPLNPRLHLLTSDARRFVRTTTRQYDVIVSDNFHPARSGSGSLYTSEHFAAVKDRLTSDGIFCQWLPLHQLDLPTLRIIVKTFVAVYPNSWAVIATNSLETPVIGLIGRADTLRFNGTELSRRRADISTTRTPEQFGLPDDLALLGSFIAGSSALTRFAADSPLNTDDFPVVSYRAPRVTYAADSASRDRINALLHALTINPEELLLSPEPAVAARLTTYWSARNRFIEAGRDVKPTADVNEMLAQIRKPLTRILQISPDFRPAYDPLLRLAVALGRADPVAARELLTELVTLQPLRPEAAEAIRNLTPPR